MGSQLRSSKSFGYRQRLKINKRDKKWSKSYKRWVKGYLATHKTK